MYLFCNGKMNTLEIRAIYVHEFKLGHSSIKIGYNINIIAFGRAVLMNALFVIFF